MPLPRPAPGTGRWWVVGILGVGAMTAWVIWYALASTVGAVVPQVTSYDVVSDVSAVVEYDLRRPAGTAVDCTITALDSRKGPVGTVLDPIDAGPQTRVSRQVEVRTSARATTVVVSSCVRQ